MKDIYDLIVSYASFVYDKIIYNSDEDYNEHSEKGDTLFYIHDYEHAYTEYKLALEYSNGNLSAMSANIRLGYCALMLKEYDLAFAHFKTSSWNHELHKMCVLFGFVEIYISDWENKDFNFALDKIMHERMEFTHLMGDNILWVLFSCYRAKIYYLKGEDDKSANLFKIAILSDIGIYPNSDEKRIVELDSLKWLSKISWKYRLRYFPRAIYLKLKLKT